MICLEHVPTYDELDSYYGNPEVSSGIPDSVWMELNLETIILPYMMVLSWGNHDKIDSMLVHKLIAPVLIDAFEEIMKYKDEYYLYNNSYNVFGGSYNYRPIRNGKRLSTHSWGISVDINPHLAPYRQKDLTGKWVNNQPEFITQAFLKRGFVTFPWDNMHFQAALSPSKYAIYDSKRIAVINGNS